MARSGLSAKISPKLLEEARRAAELKGLPLNALIERAIERYVRESDDLGEIRAKLDSLLELLKNGNINAVNAATVPDPWDIIRPKGPRKDREEP